MSKSNRVIVPGALILDGQKHLLLGRLQEAYRDRSCIDQIVSCGPDGGSKFYVHRVVLSLQSKFFKSHACKDVIEVNDVSPECMAVLMDLAYGGRAELADVAIYSDVMAAAERLEMTGLVEGIKVELSTKQMDLIRKVPVIAEEKKSSTATATAATTPIGPVHPSIDFSGARPTSNSPTFNKTSEVRKRLRKTRTVASTVAFSTQMNLAEGRSNDKPQAEAPMSMSEYLNVEVKEEIRARSSMAAIQCDMCDTTFDTKQMRNDHILLLHGPLPDTVAAGDRDKEADDQDNTDVDKENTAPRGSRKRRAATPDSGASRPTAAKKAPTTDPGPNSRPGKEYKCPKCPKAYTTLRAMKNHTTSHTATKTAAAAAPAVKKNVVCSVCGDRFPEAKLLNEHLVREHTQKAPDSIPPKKEESNRCDECDKQFVSQMRLGLHLKKFHGGRLSHQCKDCKKSFDSKRVLLDHKCMDKPLTLLQCPDPECDLKFKERAHVNRHVHDYHETDAGAIRDSMADDIMEDGEDGEEDTNATFPFTV